MIALNGLSVVLLIVAAVAGPVYVAKLRIDAADDLRPLERRQQERAALKRAADGALAYRWERGSDG